MMPGIASRFVSAGGVTLKKGALALVVAACLLPLASSLVHNDRGLSRPPLGANAAAPTAKLSMPRIAKPSVQVL